VVVSRPATARQLPQDRAVDPAPRRGVHVLEARVRELQLRVAHDLRHPLVLAVLDLAVHQQREALVERQRLGGGIGLLALSAR
jgi:hypothetical protein